jgi:hypothetical protein
MNTFPDGDLAPRGDFPQQEADPVDAGTSSSQYRLHESTKGIAVGVAIRDHAFWWLSLAFALSTLSSVALAVHLLPFSPVKAIKGDLRRLQSVY